MVLSVLSSGGGNALFEDGKYVPYYLLSDHPAYYKMFDIQNVEIEEGTPLEATNIRPSYRPRPLSYLTDNYDVQFIGWSCRQGYPHLLSASYYLFWALDCILLWVFFRRYLRLHPMLSGLLILLLSSDAVFSLAGGYFRSSKPGGVFFMIASLVAFAESVRSGYRGLSVWRSVLPAGLGAVLLFCACLYDEIPAAFAFAGVLLLGFDYLLERHSKSTRACRATLIALIAVVIAFAWWDLVGFPKLVWAITGEKVWMDFQRGTARAMLRQPVTVLKGALTMFLDSFGCLAGGVSVVLAALGLLVLLSAWDSWQVANDRQSSRFGSVAFWRKRPALARILLGGLLMVGVLYGMVSRHPPIMAIDVRRTVYVKSFTVVFVCFLAATLARSLTMKLLSKGVAMMALLILVASNLAVIPEQRRVLISHSHDTIEFTRALMVVLGKPWMPLPDFPSGEEFERLKQQIPKTRIYQAMHSQMPPDRQ